MVGGDDLNSARGRRRCRTAVGLLGVGGGYEDGDGREARWPAPTAGRQRPHGCAGTIAGERRRHAGGNKDTVRQRRQAQKQM